MRNTLVLGKIGMEGVATPRLERTARVSRPARGKWVLLVVTALVLTAWQAGRHFDYKSGSGIGYGMGLAGGIMMLLLFTYPLRKHFRLFSNWGSTRFWFTLHMTLGVLGPVLVLAHTRFHLGSVNATVAFTCMSLVAASGIVGRFIYIKIHKDLHGHRSTLDEIREQSGLATAEAESRLNFAPSVEKRMTEFEAHALTKPSGYLYPILRFLLLPAHRVIVYHQCSHELAEIYRTQAAQRGWDAVKHKRRLAAARKVVEAYLKSTQDVAQFTAYERMFSLWHVLHVPLVYMLILSAIAHVIAVHIY